MFAHASEAHFAWVVGGLCSIVMPDACGLGVIAQRDLRATLEQTDTVHSRSLYVTLRP
jgi:hypothetical protein